MTSIDYFFQVDIKTGVISWDNVEYLCQWQSQILNNAKFSEETDLNINNYLDISHEIKQDNDDLKLNGNQENIESEENNNAILNEAETEQNLVYPVTKQTKRVRNSAIHEHFHKVKIFHPVTKKPVNGSICKYCKAKFSNRISTNLKCHLMKKHPESYEAVKSKFVYNWYW